MTEPQQRRTAQDGSKFYEWNGKRYFSVTTILNALSKPALVGWAAKEAAKYAVTNMDYLNELSSKDPAATIDLIKGASWRITQASMDLGTRVHDAVESQINGEKPLVDADVAPFAVAFNKFIEETGFKPLISEGTIFNEKECYAGTFDIIGDLDGDLVLVDTKSGNNIYPEVALQLAAYSRGDFISRPDGTTQPMPVVDRAFVLHLRPKGYKFVEANISEEVYTSFLYVREAYRWQTETSKNVLTPYRKA